MFDYQSKDPTQILEGVQKYGPAPGAQKMIDWEYMHAQEAIQSGLYITYYCEQKKSQCGRLGSNSKCYCGHQLPGHNKQYFGQKFNTACTQCECKQFRNIPQRPEECGMYWLVRRQEFDITKWKPPCKCKHNTQEHSVNYPMKCQSCSCFGFNSNFACISCDRVWENHIVLYETEMDRAKDKKPIREQYLPLSANKEIQEAVWDQLQYQTFQEIQESQQVHRPKNIVNSQYVRPRPENTQAIQATEPINGSGFNGNQFEQHQFYQPIENSPPKQSINSQVEDIESSRLSSLGKNILNSPEQIMGSTQYSQNNSKGTDDYNPFKPSIIMKNDEDTDNYQAFNPYATGTQNMGATNSFNQSSVNAPQSNVITQGAISSINNKPNSLQSSTNNNSTNSSSNSQNSFNQSNTFQPSNNKNSYY